MRNKYLTIVLALFSTLTFAQSGHLMQGIGAVNMSMGGASTAQPLDISGALQWNPASISGFSGTNIGLDVGMMFSSPTLSSKLPAGMMGEGSPEMSGSVDSEKGVSPLHLVHQYSELVDLELIFHKKLIYLRILTEHQICHGIQTTLVL
jgi:long-chain fatty acid transport protein